MKITSRSRSRAVSAVIGLMSLAIAPTAAFAQQAAPSSTEVAETSDLQEIVVTGSHLRASGFTSPAPLTTIDDQTIVDRAPANVQEVLNEMPAFRPAAQTSGASRAAVTAQGVQGLPDLRGLGAVRTLTLVDGQRFVPGNIYGIVDTNMLPNSLIDHIEVVTGGASAAYGSDAVGGVVNFILKDHMEGITGNVQHGQSDYGDEKQTVASFAAGTNFADNRVHFVAGLDYTDNGGAPTIYGRPYGSVEPGLLTTGSVGSPTRPAGVPALLWANGVEDSNRTPGGLIISGPLAGVAFDAAGQPYNFNNGTVYGGSLMVGSNANYGYNPQANMLLGNPFKKETAYTRLGWDVTSDTTLYTTANFGHFSFQGQGAPPTSIGPIVIGLDNPYIPASIRSQMLANGLSTITLGKIFSTVGNNYSDQANDTWRFAIGGKGKIFSDWNWDAHAAYGQTREDYRFNGIYVANILAAADAVTGPNGAAACGPMAGNPNLDPNLASQVQPGCVPFNIFGVSSPATNPAAYRYMFQVIESVQRVSQASAGVNLNGSPVSDWAGPVELGVGLDYRHDVLNVNSDPIGAAGYYLTSGQANYGGGNYVKEGYAELGVPLAKNTAPFVKAIDLNLAARYTDYQIEGAVWTDKFGLTYDINDSWRLRATRSRDIRAPTLYDLYSRQPPSLDTVSNPFTGTTDTERYVTAGNVNLRPETADSTTAGIVFSSRAFHASLDYYRIRINNLILPSVAGTQQTVDGCHQGNQQLCADILFNSDRTINTIYLKAVNGSSLFSDGFDFESDYRLRELPFGLPGSFNVRLLASFSNHQSITNSSGTTEYSGSGGLFVDTPEPSGGGVPKWRGTLTVSYLLGPVTTEVQVTGFSPLLYSPFDVGPGQAGYNPALDNSISRNVFPGEIYVNPTVIYDAINRTGLNLQVYGVINNLLDRTPPQFALNAFSDNGANYYDVIGRTYTLGVRFKW